MRDPGPATHSPLDAELRVSRSLDNFFGDDRLWAQVAKELHDDPKRLAAVAPPTSRCCFQVWVPDPYPGLQYRRSKKVEDRYARYVSTGTAVWGHLEDNGEWLRVADRVFLPVRLAGVTLLHPFSQSQAARAILPESKRAGSNCGIPLVGEDILMEPCTPLCRGGDCAAGSSQEDLAGDFALEEMPEVLATDTSQPSAGHVSVTAVSSLRAPSVSSDTTPSHRDADVAAGGGSNEEVFGEAAETPQLQEAAPRPRPPVCIPEGAPSPHSQDSWSASARRVMDDRGATAPSRSQEERQGANSFVAATVPRGFSALSDFEAAERLLSTSIDPFSD